MGGVKVESWLVRSTLDRTEWVRAIGRGHRNVLLGRTLYSSTSLHPGHSCAANLTLGVTHPGKKGNTLSRNTEFLIDLLADPCETEGCKAPHNIGCKVVDDEAECICPTCPATLRPVCASDDVQDPSECVLRRQACLTSTRISVYRREACGMSQAIEAL